MTLIAPRILMSVALSALLGTPTATAQDVATQIVGVWKLKSFQMTEVATGKSTPFYGEKPAGYRIFTRGGHTMLLNVGENRVAPAGPHPSDGERIELFKSFAAYSGTYNVIGSKVVVRVDASWNQSLTGWNAVSFVEINGDRLTMTTAPFKSVIDGQEIVTVATLERAE